MRSTVCSRRPFCDVMYGRGLDIMTQNWIQGIDRAMVGAVSSPEVGGWLEPSRLVTMLKGSSFLSAVEDWMFSPPLLESIDSISIGVLTERVAPSGWADLLWYSEWIQRQLDQVCCSRVPLFLSSKMQIG